jgi:hypothetical protein
MENHHFSWEKLTISMAIFNSHGKLPEGNPLKWGIYMAMDQNLGTPKKTSVGMVKKAYHGHRLRLILPHSGTHTPVWVETC